MAGQVLSALLTKCPISSLKISLKKRILLLLVSIFSLGIAFGQTYDQITSIGDLTSGNYLIVADGSSNDGIMLNSTSSSVYIDHTSVTNPGATISSGFTSNNVFAVTVSGGNITIYNASVGYVSWGRTGATGNDADFHNGSVDKIRKAVEIMGRHQLGINLTNVQIDNIVAFLKTLTDKTLATNPDYSNPF